MSQSNENYGLQTTAQGNMHFYNQKKKKLLHSTVIVQKLHTHDTNMCTQRKQAPAVGYWHLLPYDSCSEPDGKQPFQFCSKPHPNTSITADSQAGTSTARQKGKWAKEPNPPTSHWQCHPFRNGLRYIWCGEEQGVADFQMLH